MLTRTRRRLALFALAVTGVTGVTGATVSLAGTATAATGCAVDYAVASQWTGGFVASVTVRNLGDPVAGWRLTWSYGAGQRVSSAWNATVTQAGAQVTAVDAGHNGSLPTGASTSFGLQGTWSQANPAPTGFAMDGVACTGAPAQPTPTSTPGPTATPGQPGPTTSPPAGCPERGRITYTLARAADPTADQAAAYELITTAMDRALAVYNCHTGLAKALTVSYNPSVATADTNVNGAIRFGARSSMQQITAMHEIAHTLGVGTVSAWSARLSGGVWTGPAAVAELRAATGDPAAVLRGDASHFWPYGLNYTSEVDSAEDLVIHCRIVAALRRDMGL